MSRTSKSVKNASYSLGFYVLNLALQFWSRKVFLDYLGTEIIGLNTTALNLLQFINIAELGVASAVGTMLYKPLTANDRTAVAEIVSLQGHVYRRIGIGVLLASCVVMLFFPIIFAKMELPLWYAYGSFGVLLFSSLLSYFINYKQVALTADQQNYKVICSFKSVGILKTLAQIYAVSNFADGYVWWLGLEALFGLVASVSLHMVTCRSFPYLGNVGLGFSKLRKKYAGFTLLIKQIFVQKLSTFALTQSSSLILYAYANLTLVTFYGNYMTIIMGVQAIINAVFNGINAGIGNLVNSASETRIKAVFDEMFSVRFAIASIVVICGWILIPPLIRLWIGSQYELTPLTLGLMLAILFIGIIRFSTDSYLAAYGMFSDVWAAIAEAILNVGLSILLGYYYGLNGILCGVLSSLILIIMIWKPYFLFSNKLKGLLKHYWFMFAKHMALLFVAFYICVSILNHADIKGDSLLGFISLTAVSALCASITLLCPMCLLHFPIIDFFKRFRR